VLHNRNEFQVEIGMKDEMIGGNREKGMNSLNGTKSESVLGRFQTLTIYEQKIVRFFDITLNLN
jgi:hypothetical protein